MKIVIWKATLLHVVGTTTGTTVPVAHLTRRLKTKMEAKLNLDHVDQKSCTLTLEIDQAVSHWDGDYHSRAYSESGIFQLLSEVVSHRFFSENSHISLLRDKELLDDYKRGDFKFREFVADKMRQENENYGFVVSDLEMWDRKRGNLKMTAIVETTVGKLKTALQDQKLSEEINARWKVQVEND